MRRRDGTGDDADDDAELLARSVLAKAADAERSRLEGKGNINVADYMRNCERARLEIGLDLVATSGNGKESRKQITFKSSMK